MKRLAFVGLTIATITGFADDEVAFVRRSSQAQKEQERAPQVTSLSSAATKGSNEWYLFGDALYWHASEGGTDWASFQDASNGPTQGNLHHVDFKWSWGFRVGLGVNTNHDGWDTDIYYTWFNTANSNGVGPADFTTSQVFDNVAATDNVIDGSIDWKIDFSMFDWEVGRWYYFSPTFALRPHVGVKGGWIHQPIKFHFSSVPTEDKPGTNYYYDYGNNYWGVGGSAGFNTLWILGRTGKNRDHRFCFFGDFAAALLYGHFDIKQKVDVYDANGELVTRPVNSFRINNIGRNLLTSMVQGDLGLSWDAPLQNDRYHFTFRVGYEFQYWLRQNQLTTIESLHNEQVHFLRMAEDLGLQGLTVDLRFDF